MLYIHFDNSSLWFKASNIANAIQDIKDSGTTSKFTISKLIDKRFFVDHNAGDDMIKTATSYHNHTSNHSIELTQYKLIEGAIVNYRQLETLAF